MEKFEQSGEIREQLKKEFLEKFYHLRDDFIDVFPDKAVTPKDPNYNRYKCRGN